MNNPKTEIVNGGQPFARPPLLDVLYREVTFVERIDADGTRKIEAIREIYRSGSGHSVSAKEAWDWAMQTLPKNMERPLWGYPDIAQHIFEHWPECWPPDVIENNTGRWCQWLPPGKSGRVCDHPPKENSQTEHVESRFLSSCVVDKVASNDQAQRRQPETPRRAQPEDSNVQ